ncbi:MAG: hypothetical protein FWG87_12635 [Defluviitaleaceae bacterium]|nr:hypothetical protein [Defluviitaleaceae bacterium]
MDLKTIKHGFNGFTQITRIRSGVFFKAWIADFPRTNPQNPCKSVFHALSVFVFGLGCHYPTATCRGRIYPSRGMHARQFTRESQALVGDGFIRPEVRTLANSGTNNVH